MRAHTTGHDTTDQIVSANEDLKKIETRVAYSEEKLFVSSVQRQPEQLRYWPPCRPILLRPTALECDNLPAVQDSSPEVSPFDARAPAYDDTFTHSTIGTLHRRSVWRL